MSLSSISSETSLVSKPKVTLNSETNNIYYFFSHSNTSNKINVIKME